MREYRASQNSFIGREAQLKMFRDVLTESYEDRKKVIFNISGQGGIGKTTLLKRFREIAEGLNHSTAYVDEGAQSNRVEDVPEALDRLAADFEKQGHKFDKFQDRYKIYRQKRQELEADPEAPQGFGAELGRMLTKASLGAAKSIPASGAVLDLVETDAVADKVGEYMAFVARKLTNKDEVKLLREPLEVLTPLFLQDLNRIAEKQTVVLLLDTYEQTGLFLDDWLRSLLDVRYGELTPNFLLGIAGRDPLSPNLWAEMEDWIARSELEPFTQNEARQYLIDRGITNEAVIQEIWRLSSGGLPLLIGMMAQAVPASSDMVVDPCDDAVERFLKWELDGAKRQVALNASLPRILNRDILSLLVNEAELNVLFEWLKGRSFVEEHPEGWQYHNIVREQMLRYQRRISPKEWAAQHKQLADYYDRLRKGLNLTNAQQQKNETWQKYTLEWLYHTLSATPLQHLSIALNGWLKALDTSQKFAMEWAKVMNLAGIATNSEEIKGWCQKLQNGLQELEEKRSDEMVKVLSKLSQETWIEDECRAIALVGQGIYPFICLPKNEGILEKFLFRPYSAQSAEEVNQILDLNQMDVALTQAVILAPDRGIYFLCRMFVHVLKRNIDEAKSDFNRALELDELGELDNEMKEQIEKILSSLENIHKVEQVLTERALKMRELAQQSLRLIEGTYGQGEEFQKLIEKAPTLFEDIMKLLEFFQRVAAFIQTKLDEIQKFVGEPMLRKDEIQREIEELQTCQEILKVQSQAQIVMAEIQIVMAEIQKLGER